VERDSEAAIGGSLDCLLKSLDDCTLLNDECVPAVDNASNVASSTYSSGANVCSAEQYYPILVKCQWPCDMLSVCFQYVIQIYWTFLPPAKRRGNVFGGKSLYDM